MNINGGLTWSNQTLNCGNNNNKKNMCGLDSVRTLEEIGTQQEDDKGSHARGHTAV